MYRNNLKSETHKTKALTSPSDNAVRELAPELGFVLWIRWKTTCNVPAAPLVLCFSASIAKEPGQQPLSRWRGWIAKGLEIPNHNLDTPCKPFQQHRNWNHNPCTSHQHSLRRTEIPMLPVNYGPALMHCSVLEGVNIQTPGSCCPNGRSPAVDERWGRLNLVLHSPSVDPRIAHNCFEEALDELGIHSSSSKMQIPKPTKKDR